MGYAYISGVKRASDELSSLGKILNTLRKYADLNPHSEALETLNTQGGPLQTCTEDLQKLALKLEPGEGLRGIVVSLKWPFREKEILQQIGRIGRHKNLFMFALNVDQA